jgi:hypothetical protein
MLVRHGLGYKYPTYNFPNGATGVNCDDFGGGLVMCQQTTSPPITPKYNPKLSFSGGSQLRVGDVWTVSISGAPPNAPVTVIATQNGLSGGVTAMGATDANGNFSKTGTMTADTLGSWAETWAVGSAPVGVISFTVVAAPIPPTPPSNPPPTPPPPVVIPKVTAPPTTSGFDFSSIPVWGWAIAAGVGVLLIGGRK